MLDLNWQARFAGGGPPPGDDLTVSITGTTALGGSALTPAPYFLAVTVDETPLAHPDEAGWSNNYDPKFLKPEIDWTITLAGDHPKLINMPAAQKTRAKRVGPYCPIILETAGSVDVSVNVLFPDGRRGSAMATITAIADDWTDLETFVISPNSNFAGAPSHDAANRLTSWNDIRNAYYAISGVTRARFLIDETQGETLTSVTRPDFDRADITQVHIGTWTPGAQATLNLNADSGALLRSERPTADGFIFRMRDMNFVGGYDPITENGLTVGTILACNTAAGGEHIALVNIDDSGTGVSINAANDQPGGSLIVQDYAKTDFADFMCLWPRLDGDVGFVGCHNVQNVNSASGWRPKGADRLGHNFFRGSGARMAFQRDEIFPRHGWNSSLMADVNPPIRLGRNNPTTMNAVVSEVWSDGPLVERQLDDDQGDQNPSNLLVERSFFAPAPMYPLAIRSTCGAMTVRNCIGIHHDTPKSPKTGTGWRSMVELRPYEYGLVDRDVPIMIYNNTLIELAGDANKQNGPLIHFADTGSEFGGPGSGGDFNYIYDQNNLVDDRFVTGGTAWDLDLSSVGFDSRNLGIRLGFFYGEDINIVDAVPDGGSILIPFSAFGDQLGNTFGLADFANIDNRADRHDVRLQGQSNPSASQIVVTAEAGGVRIVNNQGVTWGPGWVIDKIAIDAGGGVPMDSTHAHPAGTFSYYRPNTSPLTGGVATGEFISLFDFTGAIKPGNHPDAPAGSPSIGATEAL